MSEIDIDTLILAVKKRPALYNKNDPNYYSNKKHKARMWVEACKEVFADWENFKPQDKVEHVHELQRRWKSLRTCFRRELGLQKKERIEQKKQGLFKKRKRYEYFNVMSFLLEPEEETNIEGEDDDVDDDSLDPDPLESIKNEPLIFETSMHVNNSTSFEIESEPAPEPRPANATFLRPMYERSENLEDKILDMLKDIKKDEEDEDRQFMLSLVPSFRKLKAKQKFEARIEILRVLKDITFRDDDEAKPSS